MITVCPAQARVNANLSWLDSRHISFCNYYDPNYREFASLRVIEEDPVQPEKGVDTCGNRTIEIISQCLYHFFQKWRS